MTNGATPVSSASIKDYMFLNENDYYLLIYYYFHGFWQCSSTPIYSPPFCQCNGALESPSVSLSSCWKDTRLLDPAATDHSSVVRDRSASPWMSVTPQHLFSSPEMSQDLCPQQGDNVNNIVNNPHVRLDHYSRILHFNTKVFYT